MPATLRVKEVRGIKVVGCLPGEGVVPKVFITVVQKLDTQKICLGR
jgi:hypothetical protein